VILEGRGIPAAVIVTDAFVAPASAMAEVQGAPGYHYVTTPHPVAVLTPDEVRARAESVLAEVVSLITENA
jgi:hypothetical protein